MLWWVGVCSIVGGAAWLIGWAVFRGPYERRVRRIYSNEKHAAFQIAIAPWVMLFCMAAGVVEILASFLL